MGGEVFSFVIILVDVCGCAVRESDLIGDGSGAASVLGCVR